MAASLYLNACFFQTLQCFYIDSGRRQKCLAQSFAQNIIVGIQSFFCQFLFKYLAHQRKAVGMNTCRCHTDQHVACLQMFSGNHIFFVADTNCKSCQIIILLRHQSRMLCCLSANQSSLRLKTALCHTFYNRSNLFGIILSAGNIIQEKQRLAACTCNIVDAHRYSVNTNGVMLIHNNSQLHLGSAAVCSGEKHRLLHLFDLCQGKCSGKTAQASQNFLTHGLFYMLLHQLH